MKGIVLIIALAMRASVAFATEEIQAVVSGKPHGNVSAYTIGPERYLSAKEAGGVYGAQVYWYPVSGRVQMTLRGRAAQFFVNSDEARLGDSQIKLPSQVLLRADQAWLPLKFLMSETWSSFAGAETTYDSKLQILTVDRRSSLGPVRWYSYRGYTRIALDLDGRLSYSASARGVGGVEVTIPFGTVDSPEREKVEDGLVSNLQLTQGPKAAKLSIRFADNGLKWKAHELSNPRRIVVDVFSGDVVETADEARVTAEQAARVVPALPEAKEIKKEVAEASAPEKPEAQLPPPVAEPPMSSQPQPVKAVTPARRRIVVDAGHGGKDPGASGKRGILEKDIALLAAKELASLLEEEPRFEVHLTRDDDTFVELSGRTKKANDLGADLFISIHCNAARNRGESGFETYFMSEHASDPEAQRLAEQENSVVELEGKNPQALETELLLGELAKTEFVNESSALAALVAKQVEKRVEIDNRGVKQAGFYVLRGTHAPAILFEMAFITNSKDEARLHSKRFRRKIVDGIFAGVRDYARRQNWLTPPAKGR